LPRFLAAASQERDDKSLFKPKTSLSCEQAPSRVVMPGNTENPGRGIVKWLFDVQIDIYGVEFEVQGCGG
jgi:hypothetical protein